MNNLKEFIVSLALVNTLFSRISKSYKGKHTSSQAPGKLLKPAFFPNLAFRFKSSKDAVKRIYIYSEHTYLIQKQEGVIFDRVQSPVPVNNPGDVVFYHLEKFSLNNVSGFVNSYGVCEGVALIQFLKVLSLILASILFFLYSVISKFFTKLLRQYFDSNTVSYLNSFLNFARVIYSILRYAVMYQTIKRIKPDIIRISNHYSLNGLILISIASRLNICVESFQHGVIASAHPVYERETFNLLAKNRMIGDKLLVWDSVSAEFINSLKFSDATFYPEISIYPYYAENANICSRLDFVDSCFINVLVTLQPRSGLSPEWLVSLLKLTRDIGRIQFYIKLHPRQYDQFKDKETLNFYSQINSNARIVTDVNVSSICLLKYMDLHVTCFSSVTLEALSMGLPTLSLCDEFSDYFECKMNNESLLKKFKSVEQLSEYIFDYAS